MNIKHICFKVSMSFVLMISLLSIIGTANVYALEDGAYTVGRITSYPNPETGQIMDGGTNIALGNSMCDSIVDQQVLVEQVNGKTYVTLGFGMMSNVSNIRVQVQGSNGYQNVPITKTGSCTRDGDACAHYRFEVSSLDAYISPTMYIAPMGRDVQFFIKLNTGSLSAGSGNYNAEMVNANQPQAVEESTSAPEVIKESVKVNIPEDSLKGVKGITMHSIKNKKESEKSTSIAPIIFIGLGVLVLSGGGAFYFLKYKKRAIK